MWFQITAMSRGLNKEKRVLTYHLENKLWLCIWQGKLNDSLLAPFLDIMRSGDSWVVM